MLVYVVTMAPGVTFWDAGEFIAAAHVFGIPHPPGTPLFVATGRAWSLLLGGIMGVARAMNLLSAVCTAVAGGLSAWLVARGVAGDREAAWGALLGALSAGLMTSAWANATETEVYAASLLLVAVTLACAERAAESIDVRDDRWLLCTAYLIALAPAVHLSALVGAPAAIALAARRRDATWRIDRILLLAGVLVASAGIGRMSWALVGIGAIIAAASLVAQWTSPRPNVPTARAGAPLRFVAAVGLALIAWSALLIMLLRARHDPAINQGNPASLASLAAVIARRQYDVSPMWPRQAPIWLQAATLAQYVDWQFALTLGRGIFTTPARVLVTAIFLILGIAGCRAMRRDAKRTADALTVLTLCGTLGVCTYLNLKSGATIGYGFVASAAHEARERDYFFVLGFWGWGLFAGYGAFQLVRSRRWPSWRALSVVLVPLLGNWTANDRARGDGTTAARDVAMALLTSAPRSAMLFVAGDNDTYPLWYLQQVEGVRVDVTPVTLPLLPADWYAAEIKRRTGLRWPSSGFVPGAQWAHQELAAHMAQAARESGRPVAVSPAMSAQERALLGSNWRLAGAVYLSSAPANGLVAAPVVDSTNETNFARPRDAPRGRPTKLPDDVSTSMLRLLECNRLGRMPTARSAARDSLEVTCNFR